MNHKLKKHTNAQQFAAYLNVVKYGTPAPRKTTPATNLQLYPQMSPKMQNCCFGKVKGQRNDKR